MAIKFEGFDKLAIFWAFLKDLEAGDSFDKRSQKSF